MVIILIIYQTIGPARLLCMSALSNTKISCSWRLSRFFVLIGERGRKDEFKYRPIIDSHGQITMQLLA